MFQKNYIANEVIKNLKKILKKNNSLHEPELSKHEKIYLQKCLKTNTFSTIGPLVEEFEKKLKKITNSKNVIATINGTAALHISLKVIGIKKNDEVLIPALNFVASTNATLYCGAIPHFLDVDTETLGVDVDKLEVYLKKNTYKYKNYLINKKTKNIIKAIIPTHMYGNSINIEKLLKLSKKNNLKIIEDASEAMGSYYKNKHLGTFGDIGVLSFNGNKTITTGGGGAILTNSLKYSNLARHLINVSKEKKTIELSHDQIGYNYKMTNLHAAIGCAQLKKFNRIIYKKRKLHRLYQKAFKNNKNLTLFNEPKFSKSNYWLNTILLKKNNINLRNKILKLGRKNFISLRPAWKLLPELNYLNKYPSMKIVEAKTIFNTLICLPSSSTLV